MPKLRNLFGTDIVEVTSGGCNPPDYGRGKTVTETGITISKEYLSQVKVIFETEKNKCFYVSKRLLTFVLSNQLRHCTPGRSTL